MPTRPTHIPPQTIKQAKAQYQKYGPRISSQESRRLRRGAELYQRAEKLKQVERQKKTASKKEQRERQLRQEREKTQKPQVRASQSMLDGFLKHMTDQNLEGRTVEDTKNLIDSAPGDYTSTNTPTHSLSEAHNVETPHLAAKPPELDEDLSSFVVSNTQIYQEITIDPSLKSNHGLDLEQISTQDITLSPSELEELGIGKEQQQEFRLDVTQENGPIEDPDKLPSPNRTRHQTVTDFEVSTQDLQQICFLTQQLASQSTSYRV